MLLFQHLTVLEIRLRRALSRLASSLLQVRSPSADVAPEKRVSWKRSSVQFGGVQVWSATSRRGSPCSRCWTSSGISSPTRRRTPSPCRCRSRRRSSCSATSRTTTSPRISATFAWRETIRDILDGECIAVVCHVIGRECPLELRAKLELKLPARVERRLALRRASDPAHRPTRQLESGRPTWRPGLLRAVS